MKAWQDTLITGLIIGVIACLISYSLYGSSIFLSGDECPQIAAAESLRAGEGLLVSPASISEDIPIQYPGDYRVKLCWFPPGYSLLLALLASLGFKIANASLILFYLNKLLSCILWTFVARKMPIPIWQLLAVFCFQSISYMPATTTDQLLWPVAAGIFLLLPATTWRAIPVASFLFCCAIFMRWFGVIFAVIWWVGVYVLAVKERNVSARTHLQANIPLVVSLLFFLGLSYYLSGSFQPYVAYPMDHIRWYLLGKGLYFALSGGMSSLWPAAQCLLGLICLIALIGIVIQLARDPKNTPPWVLLVLVFQIIIMLFLIYTQIKKGSVFDPNLPAFAVARYYSLCQPINFALILFGVSRLLSNKALIIKRAVFALILCVFMVSSSSYERLNRTNIDVMFKPDRRGFLLPEEWTLLEKKLYELQPDLVLLKGGPPQSQVVYDPIKMLPDCKIINKSSTPLLIVRIDQANILSIEHLGKGDTRP